MTLEGLEPAADQASDQRMQLKLRVQNPNNAPIDYNGLYVELLVQGKTFATGVTNQHGAVPGFGEQVFAVPMTVSVMSVVGQVMSFLGSSSSGSASAFPDKVTYEMRGKLGTLPFKAQGQMSMPGMPTSPGEATPVIDAH